jgi:histidine ammonia-lyase
MKAATERKIKRRIAKLAEQPLQGLPAWLMPKVKVKHKPKHRR